MGIPNPLTEVPLDLLAARQSAKWRTYPSDVLPMWVAEMDTGLAPPIHRVLAEAIERGDTGYANPIELPDAFVSFVAGRFGWQLDPGACRAVPDVLRGITAVLGRVTRAGDAVVINPPVYPPFYTFIRGIDRQIVESPLVRDPTGRWGLDPERLDRDLARSEVTAYLLCNPHNPTGTVFDRAELELIGELVQRHRVRLLVDEIHAPLVYPEVPFVPFLTLAGNAAASAFVLHSASKAWNLAGLKTAVVAAGPAAADDLAQLPVELNYGCDHFGVLASQAAFREGTPWLDALVAALDHNRVLLMSALAQALPEIGYRPPDGTYLAWLDCRRVSAESDPAQECLDRGRLAVNPGPAFGPPGVGHVRLNFATSPELIQEGVRRLALTFGSGQSLNSSGR